MKRFANQSRITLTLATLMAITYSGSVQAQEQVVEYGRIVQMDDGTGSLDYLIGSEGGSVDDGKKPWLPVLSPVMIHLDCWITRMVNIHEFYQQQAADEYFAMAENCADIPLSMDPNVNTGLKYTVLAPVYAFCPDLLNRRGILGGCGGYGVPAPVPSVAGLQAQAPRVTASAATEVSASAPAGLSLQPMPKSNSAAADTVTPPRTSGQQVAASKWASMSDEQILAHFGLDPSVATRAREVAELDGSKLEAPVEETEAWQFAEEAPTVSLGREDMVALNYDSFPPRVEPLVASPAPAAPAQPAVQAPSPKEQAVENEVEVEEPASPTFSSTDGEYERMRQIERDLLGF